MNRPAHPSAKSVFSAMIPTFRPGSVLLVFLGLAASLAAQSFEQVAPKTPPPAPPAALPAATPPAGAQPDDTVLLPALRGLVFLSSPTELQAAGVSAPGLNFTGTALLDTAEFRARAEALLGRSVTLRALNELARDVVLHYRRHGRPVVDARVPEQNISTGTVQLVVLEGRLGRARAEGNRRFSAEQITGGLRLRPGEIIRTDALLEDLAWINQNPFRSVDVVFARGTNPGETDLILRTRDRFPLRVYTGYEDTGNALTGFDRVLLGANWGRPFGRDDLLNYQLTASPDFKQLVAHAFSYVLPQPRSRHTLTVFGSYAESRPELAGGFFDLDGRAWQVGARYQIPLRTRGATKLGFTAGADFKRSNNNLSFGGTQVFAQDNDVVQALAALKAGRPDAWGSTAAELTLAWSPGGLASGNHDRAFRAARSGAKARYVTARLDLERQTNLPAGFLWRARGVFQLASANLLSSEQLGLGGATSLRGYEEREANGDNGFSVVNEFQAPAFRVGAFGPAKTSGRLRPLVFVDYGLVQSHRRLAGEARRLTLASAGLGFRYELGATLSLRVDYAWQLKDSGVSDGRRNERAHAGLTVGF